MALWALSTTVCTLPAIGEAFVPDDQLVSDPSVDLLDPEFDPVGNRMVWQDLSGNLWLAEIDPATGDILPPTGQGTLVDTGLASPLVTGNGPEFAYGSEGVSLVYTRSVKGVPFIAAATANSQGSWSIRTLPGRDRWRPFGTLPGTTDPTQVVYVRQLSDGSKVVGWRSLDSSAAERTVSGTSEGGRWIPGERAFTTTVTYNGIIQAARVDADTGAVAQMTFDPVVKPLVNAFYAPELDEAVLMALQGTTAVGIYRRSGSQWEPAASITLPTPGLPYVASPEPFVHNGRSYIAMIAAAELGSVGPLKLWPIGNTEIWIAGIDPAAPFFRRVDDGRLAQRTEPEVFITEAGPVVYYTEVDPATGNRLLRRADTGLGPELGYGHPSYGGPWAAMNRDAKNCACTPFEIADTFVERYTRSLPSLQVLRPTLGPEGNLYFSYFDLSSGGQLKYLGAFDSASGSDVFRLAEAQTTTNVTGVGNLIDAAGNSYLVANEAVSKISPQGAILWQVPVPGLARAPQFAPDGNLLFFTWNGRAFVVDPDDGSVLLNRNMTGTRTYPATPDCLSSGNLASCAYLAVPAVDAGAGVVYNTFIRTDGNAALHAYNYSASPANLTFRWRLNTLSGNASSPVLSADRSRLYVQDASGNLHAVDAATGAILWSFNVGYATDKPPVVTDAGYILPGGSARDTAAYDFLGLIKDHGTHADWAWRTNDYQPLSQAAAGRADRFVLMARHIPTRSAHLLVLDPDGIAGSTPWTGSLPSSFTGVTLNADGSVIVNAGGMTGFRTYDPAP